MADTKEDTSQTIHLSVTTETVASLCANVRALAREGARRIVYVATCEVAWSKESVALWQREHRRLVTWMIGARSAGKELPLLPAWQAIEAGLGCTGDAIPADAPIGSPRRLLQAQVAAVRDLQAASGRPATAKRTHVLAKAAMLAAAVTGMTACQPNAPMNLKPDAGKDANQTRDVGIGGGICAVQFDRDALAPGDTAGRDGIDAGDSQNLDADQPDTADAYVPIGGIC